MKWEGEVATQCFEDHCGEVVSSEQVLLEDLSVKHQAASSHQARNVS